MAEIMCVGYQVLVSIIVYSWCVARMDGMSLNYSLTLSLLPPPPPPKHTPTGLFVYSSGCIVVIEDLSNSKQLHLTGKQSTTLHTLDCE